MFYSNIQEQEEADFQAGADTEFRNAYAYSRMTTHIPDASAEVRRLTALGFWVALMTWEVCCPVTDGLMGEGSEVVLASRCYEEVAARVGHESRDLYIVAPEPSEEISLNFVNNA